MNKSTDTTIKEIWRNIEGYESRYKVSNFGRVKSLERKVKFGHTYRIIEEKILKPLKNVVFCIPAGQREKPLKMVALPNMDTHPHPKRHLAKTPILKWRMYQTKPQGGAGQGLFRRCMRSILCYARNAVMS